MKGSHTFDVIVKTLEAIYKEFKIQRRIVKTITDNGSNFVKAFSVFGEKSKEYDYDIELKEQENSEADQDVVLDLDPINQVDMFAENLHDEDEEEYSLPKHQRCACHSLHLVALKDADKAEGDAQYKKVSRTAFAKCQGLWNKGRSNLVVEAITDTFKLELKRSNQKDGIPYILLLRGSLI